MNIDELLQGIQKPGRYIGGEWNSVTKEWTSERIKCLLAFPDTYEIGMSYLGMRILYGILNGRPDVLCERVFAPWADMERRLREKRAPLFSLESKRPVKDFDLIGFSLAYELNYTNVLNMLDLGGVPKRSADRKDEDPIIVAGGPSCYNPEPMSDFVDAFVVGDGEEAILEIVEAYKSHKDKRMKRGELLREMAKIEGVYVPSLYAVEYNTDGTLKRFVPKEAAPSVIKKRVVADLDKAFYPVRQIVPYIQIVHDRIVLEIMRGCRHACKFCQAGISCRPRRERSTKKIVALAEEVYRNTGYEEISLISLSSGDHSEIREMLKELNRCFRGRAVSVSIPSIRVEEMTGELPQLIREVRKSGLTFAPETGSARLRKGINKNIDIEKLLSAVSEAYRSGWNRIKLYFMIGLPDENEEDLDETAALIGMISDLRKETGKSPGLVTASVTSFIPKPHAAFQRYRMERRETIKKKQDFLKDRLARRKQVKMDFHDLDTSYMEGVFSRGDRRVGMAIMKAWEVGAKFDSWREFFKIELWLKAFRDCALDPDFYAARERPQPELLPWAFIHIA